jgi:hypothetical protein
MAQNPPPVYLLKNGNRLVPNQWVNDITTGSSELVKRNDTKALAALLSNRRYDYTARTGAASGAAWTVSYYGEGMNKDATNVPATWPTGAGPYGANGINAHSLKWGLFDPNWTAYSEVVTDHIGKASFCPRVPAVNKYAWPATHIFRPNPSQSISGEHWWFFIRWAYFYKVDGFGSDNDSDCIEGKYLLNTNYLSGNQGHEPYIKGTSTSYWNPKYIPGSQAGWSYDNLMDGYANPCWRSSGGTRSYTNYGSYLDWQAGYVPWLEVSVHVWLQPTKTNTPTPADTATGISTTLTLYWKTELHLTYGGGYYYDYNTQEGLASEYDLYFGTTLDGSGQPPFVATLPPETPGYNTNGSAYAIPYTLQAGTTYYWRVDAVNWDCNRQRQVTTGDVWTFTTA